MNYSPDGLWSLSNHQREEGEKEKKEKQRERKKRRSQKKYVFYSARLLTCKMTHIGLQMKVHTFKNSTLDGVG
jgi:hypothetical protein